MDTLETKKLYHLDEKTIAEFIERFHAPLLYFAQGFLSDPFLAEDAVGDAIVKLLVKKPRLSDENSLKAYLYKAVKNRSIDYLRKQKQEKKLVSSIANEIITSTDDDCIDYLDGRKSEVLKAISMLTGDYRQIVYLRYYEDFSITEICKITGKRKKQIYNILARIKSNLANIIQKEDNANNEIE